MFPSLLPDSFSREDNPDDSSKLGGLYFFFYMAPFLLCLSLKNFIWPHQILVGRVSDGTWLSPNLPCDLSGATCGGTATGALAWLSDLPLLANRRSSLLCAIKKKLQNLTACPWSWKRYAQIAWAGSPAYPNWISVPSRLVLTYAIKIVKFPTKPLAFCREELIE